MAVLDLLLLLAWLMADMVIMDEESEDWLSPFFMASAAVPTESGRPEIV